MSNSNVPNYLGTGYGPAVEDDNLSQILDDADDIHNILVRENDLLPPWSLPNENRGAYPAIPESNIGNFNTALSAGLTQPGAMGPPMRPNIDRFAAAQITTDIAGSIPLGQSGASASGTNMTSGATPFITRTNATRFGTLQASAMPANTYTAPLAGFGSLQTSQMPANTMSISAATTTRQMRPQGMSYSGMNMRAATETTQVNTQRMSYGTMNMRAVTDTAQMNSQHMSSNTMNAPATRMNTQGMNTNTTNAPSEVAKEKRRETHATQVDTNVAGQRSGYVVPQSYTQNRLCDMADPFCCPICYHAYRSSGGVRDHMKRVHGWNIDQINANPDTREPKTLGHFARLGVDNSYRGSEAKQVNARRRWDEGMTANSEAYWKDVYKSHKGNKP